ncbi:MAG: FtsX-like permease family protein, partial [Rhodospirillales bacterium]|nr:FtsX-like permease family protein [Rhodospirillales bacterium]
LVVGVGLAGLVAVIVASLGERRRELAILRALGARPVHIFTLLAGEGITLTFLGCVFGLALLYGGGWALGPFLEAHFGLVLSLGPPTSYEMALLGAVLAAGLVASLIPGWRAYRMSVADGMIVRT